MDDLEIIALLNDFVHRFVGRLQAGQARRQSGVVSDNARTECAIAQNKIEGSEDPALKVTKIYNG